jgi:hypothetical protein
MRPDDTSPEAWRVFIDMHRKMSPHEKLDRTFELRDLGRALCEAGIRSRYPEASDREIFLRLTERMLSPDLFRKVYGDVIPAQ